LALDWYENIIDGVRLKVKDGNGQLERLRVTQERLAEEKERLAKEQRLAQEQERLRLAEEQRSI
jgi:hypothetical protein